MCVCVCVCVCKNKIYIYNTFGKKLLLFSIKLIKSDSEDIYDVKRF